MTSDEDVILISRLLDGDLASDEEIQLKERLLSEPELRELYDALGYDQQLLDDMTGKVDEEPLPVGLEEQLGSKENSQGFGFPAWQALAAAIVLLGVGFVFVLDQQPVTLAEVLETSPSGTPLDYDKGTLTIVATFRASQGWCREYETASERAVACRTTGGWQAVASESKSPANPFETAASESAVQGFVLDNIQGQPLDLSEERGVLGRW